MDVTDIEAKENGCICEQCSALGYECTNITEYGEDECPMCEIGIHGQANKLMTEEVKRMELANVALKIKIPRGAQPTAEN